MFQLYQMCIYDVSVKYDNTLRAVGFAKIALYLLMKIISIEL